MAEDPSSQHLFLYRPPAATAKIPGDLQHLLERRQTARQDGDHAQADKICGHILSRGFKIIDGPDGPRLEPR